MEITSADTVYAELLKKLGQEEFDKRKRYAEIVANIIAVGATKQSYGKVIGDIMEAPTEYDEVEERLTDAEFFSKSFWQYRIEQTMLAIGQDTFDKWQTKFDAGDEKWREGQAALLMRLVENMIKKGQMI